MNKTWTKTVLTYKMFLHSLYLFIFILQDDVFHLKDKIVNMGVQRGLILRYKHFMFDT